MLIKSLFLSLLLGAALFAKTEVVVFDFGGVMTEQKPDEEMQANSKMYALVDQLAKNNVRVALFSNVSARHAVLWRGMGLYRPFYPCILSCDINAKKPQKRSYKLMISILNFHPKEILFIDNQPKNIEAAQTFGIDAFVFESADQVEIELKKRGLLHAGVVCKND